MTDSEKIDQLMQMVSHLQGQIAMLVAMKTGSYIGSCVGTPMPSEGVPYGISHWYD